MFPPRPILLAGLLLSAVAAQNCTLVLENSTAIVVEEGLFPHPDYCNRECRCEVSSMGIESIVCPNRCIVDESESSQRICADDGEDFVQDGDCTCNWPEVICEGRPTMAPTTFWPTASPYPTTETFPPTVTMYPTGSAFPTVTGYPTITAFPSFNDDEPAPPVSPSVPSEESILPSTSDYPTGTQFPSQSLFPTTSFFPTETAFPTGTAFPSVPVPVPPPVAPPSDDFVGCDLTLSNGTIVAVPPGTFAHPEVCQLPCRCRAPGEILCPVRCVVANPPDPPICANLGETFEVQGQSCTCQGDGSVVCPTEAPSAAPSASPMAVPTTVSNETSTSPSAFPTFVAGDRSGAGATNRMSLTAVMVALGVWVVGMAC